MQNYYSNQLYMKTSVSVPKGVNVGEIFILGVLFIKKVTRKPLRISLNSCVQIFLQPYTQGFFNWNIFAVVTFFLTCMLSLSILKEL